MAVVVTCAEQSPVTVRHSRAYSNSEVASFEGLSEEKNDSNWQTFRPSLHECTHHSEAPARLRFVFQGRSRSRVRA